MKISLNLIRYINDRYNCAPDPYAYGVDEIVKRIGLQLGAVEGVEKMGEKYDGVIVAKVITCIKHPNADKLSLCTVDDGGVVANVERNEEGHVQVVCGALNVREGLLVAWIPPGVAVPSTHGADLFVLEARELRGKVSNGMIASPSELAMSDDHDGILEINPDNIASELAKPGVSFRKLYGLDDVIIDCENKMFTHRPDCFGILGVAREIAGIFGDAYSSPQWYKNSTPHTVDSTQLELQVENKIKEVVPRFIVQVIRDVEVTDSPMWLQRYLKSIGSKSINNIVDYTNYFMMLTGQPLHAFDYDKVKKLSRGDPTIQARMAEKGEKLALLNGKTIQLDEKDIVIATDKTPIGLAGVMGGADSEVDVTTKNIIIECASFDMYSIRRTSMRHGLFTDAVTRFNKGQSPLQNDRVLAKIVEELKINANGKVASQAFDIANFDTTQDNLNHLTVTHEFINDRLGTSLKPTTIKNLLENVEFQISVQGDSLYVTVPFWRMDIEIGEDIVEEVGRLYGYQNIPIVLPKRSIKPAPKNTSREFKQMLRDRLIKSGANELLTYSFVHADLLKNTGTDPETYAYHLRNALSPELQYYRTSLMPSLLAKVHSNIKAQAGTNTNEFALFEFGKAHVKGCENEEKLPEEFSRLAFVFTADHKTADRYESSPYYQAKLYLDMITNSQAIYAELDSNEHPISGAYQLKRSAMVSLNGQTIGVIGEFNEKTRKFLKLPRFSAGFELDVGLLQENMTQSKYIALGAYPLSSQDVTFELSEKYTWVEVANLINAELAVISANGGYRYELEPLELYKPKDESVQRLSFRVTLQHQHKTLKTEEVTKAIESLSGVLNEKLAANRI